MASKRLLDLLHSGVLYWNTNRDLFPHAKVNLRQANLRKANLKRANLSRADLKDADLRQANLRQANLTEADLRQADLREADLSLANLTKANLTKTNLRGAIFKRANLSSANLIQAVLKESILTRAELSEANLREADLWRAQLNSVSLNSANLFKADIEGAYLAEANLRDANLNDAFLSQSNLTEADLTKAALEGAYLLGTDLSRAKLIQAGLAFSHLTDANLRGADLTGTDLTQASLVTSNLEGAILKNCRVYGISAWDLNLNYAEQSDLIITDESQPIITVDNLEVAQFIYLLLSSEKIRSVIDTITSKVVLILGRFTPERKAVLDAIRKKLRDHNYLPVVFDFEKPSSRDLTETISTLAHISRFVIADITEAKSVPQELECIVPDLPSVPIQPIIQSESGEYSMFEHFKKYPWVLHIHCYKDSYDLMRALSSEIIAPVEAKVKEIRESH